jgi:hypothetical protein
VCMCVYVCVCVCFCSLTQPPLLPTTTYDGQPVKFASLASLVDEYRTAYEDCYHKLLTVYVGLPMPHNIYIDQPLKWRATKVRVYSNSDTEVAAKINRFANGMSKTNAYFLREGCLPDNTRKA